MILYILLILIYIDFSFQNNINSNGVYNLMFNNLYLYYSKRKIYLKEKFKYPNTFFRFTNPFEANNNEYYYIEEITSKNRLGFYENKEIIFQRLKNNVQLWKIIQFDKDYYSIVNKVGCYMKVIELKLMKN